MEYKNILVKKKELKEISKTEAPKAQTRTWGRGRAVTTADPPGSDKTLKANSQCWDEGNSVWRHRR